MKQYTIKEVAIMLGMTNEAIVYRAKNLGYEKKHSIYLFNSNQLNNIINFRKKRLITEFEGEVIYTKVIVQTIEVYHSKLNFT